MSDADQDKTEQPTSFRLEEARKRGEVARSQDITGVLVLIVFASVLTLTVGDITAALANATRAMVQVAASAPTPGMGLMRGIASICAPLGHALMPLVLALMVAAVLGNVLQTGLIFTTHPLTPDPKRLNPAQAFKRLFALRSLWELGKMGVKFLLLAVLCWLTVRHATQLVESAMRTSPGDAGSLLLHGFVRTSVYVLMILGLVALADLMFSRRNFMRQMRMSRRELKEEVKRRDGDPGIKGRRREKLRELLKKSRALGRVAEADMVLTNPTHVAVALRYRPGQTLGPVVIAKGAGMMAAHIRSLASRHSVPVWPSMTLARALYRECDIDQMVPESQYGTLAPLYRRLWAQRGAAA
ncbi:EscU/YscU/HrcU family type III secretion system export apparatus switch protein [Stenotrophomonas aracearum]|jgi:flagellar biosynthetic protein FlhB|uniref:Flagellar biosynthetic protein FlhB n=1 Tax=Stenotrophomonas aracearum TaxID=3003272 RepID=A0ABY9YDA8_9GAMM|nr:EscU/YscU/HrcU family type III secretion system export apparatus switch protein [Stenotrophomonas sp. A5588]WNH48601.1 EscU/YscU/HrcU family type III secretion system export apparatus switch protein [Stenotrophomonas sp. A5588]